MNEKELKVIISAEIDKLKQELQKGQKEVENFGKKSKVSFQDFNNGVQKAGDISKKALATVGVAVAGAATALLALSASTAEYRENQAKLATAFESAGASAEVAKETYNDLYRVLGDDGQATEAANHLAKLTQTEQGLAEWTNICQGVYATFGDSLPIEGLTEAANETAKVGTLTGSLADALNWAGVNEEAFQAQLDACNTEAEREALIRQTLNGLYSEASANYEKNAASTLAANDAQRQLNDATAKLGEAIAPVQLALTNLAIQLLEKIVPIIQDLMENYGPQIEETLTKVADAIGNVLSWVIDNWGLVSTIGTVILAIAAALSVLSTVMTVVNAVTAASPVTWIVLGIVAAIAALVAIIVLVVKYWDELKASALDCWEGIKSSWNDLATWFDENVIQPIVSLFSGLWEGILSIFSSVGSWFTNAFTQARDGVKNAFSSITGFFSNIWEKIKSIFSKVGTAIGDGIKGAVSGAVNKVLSFACKVINGFINAINFAIDIINAIPGVSISRLNTLSVPAMAKGGVVDSATLAVIGEQGKEAVVPLENNLGWLDKLATMLNERMGGSGPIILKVDGRTLAEATCSSINQLTRQRGSIPLNII